MNNSGDGFRLDGRILILGIAPGAVERQLSGQELTLDEAGPLRDNISTDEITPLPSLLHYGQELARESHTGTRIGNHTPLTQGVLDNSRFSVLVAGSRYGKGSSREHAPLSEYLAGVRLIIAKSFERIYRQNCDSIGLLTSTDMGLVDRLRAGETIPLDDIVMDRDPLTQDIIRAGGLLAYGQKHLHDIERVHPLHSGPMTLAQKIVAHHVLATSSETWNMQPGSSGFVRADIRFMHDIYTAMAADILERARGQDVALFHPESIVMFEDHYSYAHRSPNYADRGLLPQIVHLSRAHRDFVRHHNLTDHGYLVGEEGSEGISHAMMAELYALPGQLIAGTDSHTPHCGALGCFAFGVGTTDMCNAFLTGAVRLTMAESVRIELNGKLEIGVTAKDIALALLATPAIHEGVCVGRIVEFSGPVVTNMSIDERTTLTNMIAEFGGLTGLCPPDAETVRFLKERRGIEFQLEDWMQSDPGAVHAATITLDCSTVRPMLARPGDPGNGVAVSDLDSPVLIDIAYGGSCTAGKRDDFDNYHEVALWGLQHGLRVPDHVTLFLQCGTVQVREYCISKGYLETFKAIGAEILGPACGACAQCGPGVSTRTDQVTISAINRNFPGRGGPGKVWLANPATVVASALAGKICSFTDLQQTKATTPTETSMPD
ncbi:MAG: 3-isopropylmalate dehydratase [Thalassospira sp.]|uniref:aconitase family protein n=1 Tax=Thalassospira sp. TaxID=1912094 RepID=UPI000C6B035C|nr:aconitase family protein [Thalassospira sp.]MAZ31936.1 3-isopropylmalate dehydratase [Thalassospira sp.]